MVIPSISSYYGTGKKKKKKEIMPDIPEVNIQKELEEKSKKEKSKKEITPSIPVIGRTKKGEITTITTPEGKQYITAGLKRSEQERMAGAIAEKYAPIVGTMTSQEFAAQKEQMRQQEAAAQAAARLGQLTPEQIAMAQQQIGGNVPPDWGQALTAGGARALPSFIGGAAGGAAVGAVAGAGVGAIPGAIIGGVGGLVAGFLSGIQSNIKAQQSGQIGTANEVLTQGKANMRQLRMLSQADIANAEKYVDSFNDQLALIYAAERKLQLETQGNLNKFMDDGTEDKAKFELFLMDGGYADIQMMRIQETLSSGVPLTPEQILYQLQMEGDLDNEE